MSIVSTTANYGGKISDNQQNIKQFYTSSPSTVSWIYKRTTTEGVVITPSDDKRDIYINNNLTVKKDLYVEGSIYNPSDEKLKENIEFISIDQTENIFKINPINFSYKHDKDKLKHFGFLAQDVEKVFPELVNTNKNDYKSVNYQELIPIMLSKMKQMQDEIDELKEQVKK